MGVLEVDRVGKYDDFKHVRDGVVSELELGSPLNAISISGDQRYGVVGGRDLMKVMGFTSSDRACVAPSQVCHENGLACVYCTVQYCTVAAHVCSFVGVGCVTIHILCGLGVVVMTVLSAGQRRLP